MSSRNIEESRHGGIIFPDFETWLQIYIDQNCLVLTQGQSYGPIKYKWESRNKHM
jgi:hypothetical protein